MSANLEELRSLQNAVVEVEKLIAGSPQKKSSVLSDFLVNAKKRLEFLEREVKADEQRASAERSAAINAAAQQEAALSQQERKTFTGFLEKEFFTKKDFGSLEAFYSGPWDRLSKKGKEEMSHRIWEGVRHGEYKFSELPEIIKEKEAERLAVRLKETENPSPSLAAIPEEDRKAFLKAYESGHREEVFKILDRDSFKNNVEIKAEKPIEHAVADRGREGEMAAIAARTGEHSGSQSKLLQDNNSMAKLDLASVDLKNLKISDSGQAPSDLPKTGGVKTRS